MEVRKAVFKMNVDCGRMGMLGGVFIATQERVDCLIGNKVQVYFGEVLGKHSEICGAIEEEEIEFITNDPVVVEIIEEHGLHSGYNPFWYSTPEGMDVDEVVDKLLEGKSLNEILDELEEEY